LGKFRAFSLMKKRIPYFLLVITGFITTVLFARSNRTVQLIDDFEVPFGQPVLRNAVNCLAIPTYDGSGALVHPDVLYFAEPWRGAYYWMAFTPYYNGDFTYENPSIVHSSCGIEWVVPEGLSNPIYRPPAGFHNNDVDLVYSRENDELWCYFRENPLGETWPIAVKRAVSSDGVDWAISTIISSGVFYNTSPAVVPVNDGYYMFVREPPFRLMLSKSPDGMDWGEQIATDLASGVFHHDVFYDGTEFKLLYYVVKGAVARSLRYATSPDGITWKRYLPPVLIRSDPGWDSGTLYRASFNIDTETRTVTIWYSGRTPGEQMRVGLVSGNYPEMLAALSDQGGWEWVSGEGYWNTDSEVACRGNYSGRMEQELGEHMRLRKNSILRNSFWLEFDMYDDLSDGVFGLVRLENPENRKNVGIGIAPSINSYYYVCHDHLFNYQAGVAREEGWRRFSVSMDNAGTFTFYADGQEIGAVSNQFAEVAKIRLQGSQDHPGVMRIDDIVQYRWPTPAP